MANRTLYPQYTVDRQQVDLPGSFATNGASNPVATTVKGQGFTVVRSGVGQYTVTTTDPYADCIAWGAQVSMGTPTDETVVCSQPQQVTVGVSKRWQFLITTFAGAAAADLASAAGNSVAFNIVLAHSGSKPY